MSRTPAASTAHCWQWQRIAYWETAPWPSRAISQALAARDLGDAEMVAADFGLNHRVIRTDELQREGYVANSPQRCYFCKTELYDQLAALAATEGFQWICNGANTDDLGDYRPGMTAAAEHNIRSPMVEAGMDRGSGPRRRPLAGRAAVGQAGPALPLIAHTLWHCRSPWSP